MPTGSLLAALWVAVAWLLPAAHTLRALRLKSPERTVWLFYWLCYAACLSIPRYVDNVIWLPFSVPSAAAPRSFDSALGCAALALLAALQAPRRWPARDGEPPRELPVLADHGPRGSAPRHLPGREDWAWIRTQNDESARAARRAAAALTVQCAEAGGYVLNGSRVELKCVEDMCSRTQILSPSLGSVQPPGPCGQFPETGLRKMPAEVLSMQAVEQLADEPRHREGGGVAVVSAASAYHCGGGFLTGGRHALEEAICTQTTLFPSLDEARRQRAADQDSTSSQETHFAYIPQDGVVLSPRVELFREGSSQGYPFMQRPLVLAAVISVAMFNKNPSVGDAPLDAPDDQDAYERIVASKFRSVLSAAAGAGVSALVLPDVGCGVYMNDPAVVGRVFGEVLYREYWGQLRDVALCGKREFQDAVEMTVQREAQAARAPVGA